MAKFQGGENHPIYSGAKPELFRIAGVLRDCMTPSERLLWAKLRNRKLIGYKFRRQHPFHKFILDFFCYDAMLSIEVDGIVHNDSYQRERDGQRTVVLKRFGITELRFTNHEVENEIEKVLDVIKEYLKSYPLPTGGGRAGDRG
jgi:very-short-patch-repair endonuclease